MSFADLLNYIYQAMSVSFTVFGVTLNLWSFFVFSAIFSVVAWFIRNFFGGDDD